MRAISASFTESCGAPTTRTSPSASSRSCSAASSMWLATFFALSATAFAARSTDEPAVTVCRLAKPPSPSDDAGGVARHHVDLLDAQTPSWLAAICASAVPSPCPIADAPVNTVTLPVREMRTRPDSNGPRPVPFTPCDKPDAEIAAVLARRRLPRREIVPADRRQHLGLAGRIVAAVVLDRHAGARLERLRVRHLLRRNEIAPPHLGAVELHLARRRGPSAAPSRTTPADSRRRAPTTPASCWSSRW